MWKEVLLNKVEKSVTVLDMCMIVPTKIWNFVCHFCQQHKVQPTLLVWNGAWRWVQESTYIFLWNFHFLNKLLLLLLVTASIFISSIEDNTFFCCRVCLVNWSKMKMLSWERVLEWTEFIGMLWLQWAGMIIAWADFDDIWVIHHTGSSGDRYCKDWMTSICLNAWIQYSGFETCQQPGNQKISAVQTNYCI